MQKNNIKEPEKNKKKNYPHKVYKYSRVSIMQSHYRDNTTLYFKWEKIGQKSIRLLFYKFKKNKIK